MGYYEPRTADGLASIVDYLCQALQTDGKRPLTTEMKQALALRVIELFENGIADPDELTIGVMADHLWALSQPSSPIDAVTSRDG